MRNELCRETPPNKTLRRWAQRACFVGAMLEFAGCSTKLVSDGSKGDPSGGGAAGADGDGGSMTGSGGTSAGDTAGRADSSATGSSQADGSGGTGLGGSGAGGTSSGAGGSAGGSAGAPGGQPLGESCSNDDDCESGECADGVCCNESCEGVCMRCDAAESLGTCAATESDAACGELTCPESTECRQYLPGDLANNCLERGVCVSEAPCTVQDDPDNASCGTQESPGTCDGEGECVVPDKAGLGDACSADDDCGSQHCVAGIGGNDICCDTACDGVCEGCGADGRCNVAPDDDDRCVVDCNNSTSCTTYPADPVADRCSGFGQCVTKALYCTASHKPAGTDCGTNRSCNGSGSCVLTCPTNSGASRTCSSECPCGIGEGVCTSNAHCDSGLLCGTGAGVKFGFGGNDTCVPAHCDNDVKDATETSIDCGGECGCTASVEWFSGSGFVEGISDDGSTIVGRTTGASGYAYYWNANLQFTQLTGSAAYGANGTGSVIVGAGSTGPARWLGGGITPSFLSEAEFSSGSALSTSANGQVIVGSGYNGVGFFGYVWNSGTITWNTSFTSFLQVSADGLVMLGDLAVGDYVIRQGSNNQTIQLPSGRAISDPPVLSRDGKLVVGRAVLDPGGGDVRGFVWQVGSGQAAMLFDGNGDPYPTTIADTGLIAGQIGRGGLPGIYWHPDDSYTPRLITELMAAHGLEPEAALTYGGVEAITPDGRVIVGTGTNGKYRLKFDESP